MSKVSDFYAILNEMAPFDTQEEYDNAGLILGDPDTEVKKVLVALDVTEEVVKEAIEKKAELIISHHPLMFHARKNLVERDPESRILCSLIREHISLISAHTNLDKTVYSGSACCAEAIGLKNIRQEGYLFIGELPVPMEADELEMIISKALHAPVRTYGDGKKQICSLAIGGGACDGELLEAKNLGADAFLTGEVRHHNALTASMIDFVLFDGTHYGTENILVPSLTAALQKRANSLQYQVDVIASKTELFRF